MSQDQLAVFLPLGRVAFRPKELLLVTVLWALEAAPRSIELRMYWRTQGKGSADLEIVSRASVSVSGPAGEETVSLILPDSPWSFSGKLISLSWGVEVVAEPGGQSARVEFVLGPKTQEILLPSLD